MKNLLKFLGIFLILFAKFHFIICIGYFYTSLQEQLFYVEGEQKFTWYEALTQCTKMNMSLLTIDTKSKSDDVTALLKSNFDKKVNLWMGAVVNGDNPREFVWIATGRKFDYTNWGKGQPDFVSKNEYCVEIGFTDNMDWNDLSCTSKLGFICEFSRYNHSPEENVSKEKYEIKKTESKTLLDGLLPDGRTFRDMIFNINSNAKCCGS